MSLFLTLSAMTSAALLLMTAAMDWRLARAKSPQVGRIGSFGLLLSAFATLPVAWVIWVAEGSLAALALCLGSALWHYIADLLLFRRTRALRAKAGSAKKA